MLNILKAYISVESLCNTRNDFSLAGACCETTQRLEIFNVCSLATTADNAADFLVLGDFIV